MAKINSFSKEFDKVSYPECLSSLQFLGGAVCVVLRHIVGAYSNGIVHNLIITKHEVESYCLIKPGLSASRAVFKSSNEPRWGGGISGRLDIVGGGSDVLGRHIFLGCGLGFPLHVLGIARLVLDHWRATNQRRERGRVVDSWARCDPSDDDDDVASR